MIGSDKNKELVPKGEEDDISPFFSHSPFSDFDSYISELMHRHHGWYDHEFNDTLNRFDSFFKDFFDENMMDHSYFFKKRTPMELKEFSALRPKFFPSSFFSAPFFSAPFSSSFPFSSPFSSVSSPSSSSSSSSSLSPYPPRSFFSQPFSSMLHKTYPGWSNMNISDKGKKIEIVLKAPGLSKEDLEIDVDNDRLNIKGMRMDEFQETGQNNSYHFKEKKMSCFQQSILLPDNADPDNVRATLKDGILKIDIDKLDQSEKKKVQIE